MRRHAAALALVATFALCFFAAATGAVLWQDSEDVEALVSPGENAELSEEPVVVVVADWAEEQKPAVKEAKEEKDEEGGGLGKRGIIGLSVGIASVVVVLPLVLCCVCGCVRCNPGRTSTLADDGTGGVNMSETGLARNSHSGSPSIVLDVRGSSLAESARQWDK